MITSDQKPVESGNPAPNPSVIPKSLTFGEELAGITFNPSLDSHVDKVKAAAAKFMDAIHDASWSNQHNGETIDDTHIKMKL